MTDPVLTFYPDLEQGSQAWLDARCGLLTASVIGKLLTPTLKVSDNETSRGLTLTLAAERITGHVEYVHPTFDMQRGTDDEPFARALYAEHHAPVKEIGFATLQGDGYKIGYSPDGLVGEDGLIECKSRQPKGQLIAILSDRPPTTNMAQMQAGMFVTGRAWCDYISYSAGLPLFVKRVHADPNWFAAIEAAAIAFETNVTDVIARYTNASRFMPATERRPELDEIRI